MVTLNMADNRPQAIILLIADFRGSKFNEDFGRFQHFDPIKQAVGRELFHSFFPHRGGFIIFPDVLV